jgi:hypothetical protein
MATPFEPANEEQIRFLISLYRQLAIPYDPADLAQLSKWDAAAAINVLRGRRATTPAEMDEALMQVLELRRETFGERAPEEGPEPQSLRVDPRP